MTLDSQGGSASIRVLIVDDHPAVREGLVLLLSTEGINVCAEASKKDEALAHAETLALDLAIVDLSLDGDDGLFLVSDLKDRGIPVLVYSMHNDAVHVEGAFAAGALGYVTKSEFRGVLVEAVRAVFMHDRFVSPKAAITLAERFAGHAASGIPSRLSGKEQEVYQLIGRGEGTHEIAIAMKISTHTVESYYARIQQKLGVSGMHELRRHAIEFIRQRVR